MTIIDDLYHDLHSATEWIYDKAGLHFSGLQKEKESQEYAACSFLLNNRKIIYRAAKITPTKNGQFVTTWKRNEEKITTPFSATDGIDFLIISCRNNTEPGHFIFPLAVLVKHKIVSADNGIGKRGIRVYPPWDVAGSKQALTTQTWQAPYFIYIEKDNAASITIAHRLLASGYI